MNPHNSPVCSWSDLPVDLLLDIGNRLKSRLDRLRFRAMCPSWRSVFPLPKHKPLPPFKPCISLKITEETVYLLQPLKKITNTSESCLIRIQEQEGKIRLIDTFFDLPFPRLHLFPSSPRNLNLLDYKIFEVTKMYGLRGLRTVGRRQINSSYNNLAVCFEGDDFVVMRVHKSGRLLFWKHGQDDRISVDEYRYCSVVYNYRNRMFYAARSSGLTVTIDLMLNIKQVAPAVPNFGLNQNGNCRKVVYLVNSNSNDGDDLFLVVKNVGGRCYWDNEFFAENEDFQVYKLNEEMGEWVRIKSLGDRAIFVCEDGNFILLAKEFPGCKKNCIYYHFPSFQVHRYSSL